MHDFVAPCIDHLDNIGPLIYVDLPLTCFITQQFPGIPLFSPLPPKKTLFVNITTALIRKVFKFGEAIVSSIIA